MPAFGWHFNFIATFFFVKCSDNFR
jgi:hypothetical protein